MFVTDDEYESGSDKEDSDKYGSDDGKKSVVSKVVNLYSQTPTPWPIEKQVQRSKPRKEK